MPHPLVLQLRFARREFRRALHGVSGEDAVKHIEPMNCISWIVGHLAWQEQRYWLTHGQGITPAPEVNAFGFGQPMSTPDLDEMWAAWTLVTETADPWLDTLDIPQLTVSEGTRESIGTRLLRTTYHYWYHIGESQAIRQIMGHQGMGAFVGGIGEEAPYIPED